MKYTDNMELLLYDANDIMNTNDFVNQNNQKIDTYVAGVKATAEEANAGQQTANTGLTEVNGKVNTINQQLTDGELATLPQFKANTEGRLETLEDMVALQTKPDYGKWKLIATGNYINTVCDTVVGFYFIDDTLNLMGASSNTLTCRKWEDTNIVSNYNYKLDAYSRPGNVYNLPEINTIYMIYGFGKDVDSGSNTLATLIIGAYYNGVDTVITFLTTAKHSTSTRVQLYGFQTILSKAGPNTGNTANNVNTGDNGNTAN